MCVCVCVCEHASQLLVQALVQIRLDYCSTLLAGLPASPIKPLQLIHNAAAGGGGGGMCVCVCVCVCVCACVCVCVCVGHLSLFT